MHIKISKIIAVIIIALLATTLTVQAAVLNRAEENSTVKISLTSDVGNVKAMLLVVKIEGAVNVENFTWASNIKEEYTKKEVYDKANKTITIFIATGNTDNLVAEDGIISIGSIKVNADKTTDYNITLQSVEVVDASYTKTVPEEKKENSNVGFTYTKTPVTPEEPEEPGDEENKPAENTTTGENTMENTTTGENTTENTTTGGNTTSNTITEENTIANTTTDGNTIGNSIGNVIGNNVKTNEQENLANGKLPQTGENNTLLIILISILGIILAITAIYYYKKKNKR